MTDLTLPDDPIALAFQSDPLTLDPNTIKLVIAEFRRRRSEFQSKEAAASLKPAKAKKPKPEATLEAANLRDRPIDEINLEDL
jgi:hemolysin activation/secretion protein